MSARGGGAPPASAAHTRFQETARASGLSEEQSSSIWAVVEACHTEAHRACHNLSHLLAVFEFIRRAVKSGYALRDPCAVDWAVWFHDAVYDPRSSTNEADSAALAAELLSAAGLQGALVNKVRRYIMATGSHHHLAGDGDADLLVDADLSVLAAPLPRYVEYAAAVRREHGHLSDGEFAEGRAHVLKGLLDREQLFQTDIGKSACEAAARANMAHEWQRVFGGQPLLPTQLEEVDGEGGTDDEVSAAAAAAAEAADGSDAAAALPPL